MAAAAVPTARVVTRAVAARAATASAVAGATGKAMPTAAAASERATTQSTFTGLSPAFYARLFSVTQAENDIAQVKATTTHAAFSELYKQLAEAISTVISSSYNYWESVEELECAQTSYTAVLKLSQTGDAEGYQIDDALETLRRHKRAVPLYDQVTQNALGNFKSTISLLEETGDKSGALFAGIILPKLEAIQKDNGDTFRSRIELYGYKRTLESIGKSCPSGLNTNVALLLLNELISRLHDIQHQADTERHVEFLTGGPAAYRTELSEEFTRITEIVSCIPKQMHTAKLDDLLSSLTKYLQACDSKEAIEEVRGGLSLQIRDLQTDLEKMASGIQPNITDDSDDTACSPRPQM